MMISYEFSVNFLVGAKFEGSFVIRHSASEQTCTYTFSAAKEDSDSTYCYVLKGNDEFIKIPKLPTGEKISPEQQFIMETLMELLDEEIDIMNEEQRELIKEFKDHDIEKLFSGSQVDCTKITVTNELEIPDSVHLDLLF